MAYKDKPLKLRNFISLKITHLKYYDNRINVTQSSRPLIPPSLKRLVKAVEPKSRAPSEIHSFVGTIKIDLNVVETF